MQQGEMTSHISSPHCSLRAALPADASHIELSALVQRCVAESERFYRGQPHDASFAYELFRRALVERDETAWEHVFIHYSPLVDSWVRRNGAFSSSGESSEFFVVSAFARFWRAIPPARFASFQTLAQLLQYLQRCAGCVVIDSVRTQPWGAEVLAEDVGGAHALVAPDEEAVERLNRAEFWDYIGAQLRDESERVVVFDTFVMGMRPSDIFDRRPDLFGCINDVYNVKRNVIGRLSRNQELRRMMLS